MQMLYFPERLLQQTLFYQIILNLVELEDSLLDADFEAEFVH